jgi:hypothetical protein
MNSSDFEIAKALYELDSQHVASMSQLIEKAVATEPFPEESFWKAHDVQAGDKSLGSSPSGDHHRTRTKTPP